jgi:type IV secretion system protein TrbE
VEVTNDTVGFGYLTTNVQVWDKDYKKAHEKATFVKQVINQRGFSAFVETFNAFEAWLGMMPGNVYANIRRPLVSTGNMSQVIPLTAVWSGDRVNNFFNDVLGDGTPHVTCSTRYGTPFYLSLAVGDVMHTCIVGTTGGGKTTIANTFDIQFLRYENVQIVIFDKDRSARQITMAVGGTYYEPGDGKVSFQPLRNLEKDEDIVWACEFIELIADLQGVVVDASARKAIRDGVKVLATLDIKSRTLTAAQQYIQNSEIKSALEVYTLNGAYGSIFDADSCSISKSNWIMIEMGKLIAMKEAAVTPALMYLFRVIDEMFDGRPGILQLDEAWMFLKHPILQRKLQEWLKTLRKKRIGVIFITQEIADITSNEIGSTIIEQCHTKIFLPNENATSPHVYEQYKKIGLTDDEISVIARARLKRDYFYKSSKGTRLFTLELGRVQLGLLGKNENSMLDEIEKIENHDDRLQKILEMNGIDETANQYLEENPYMDTREGVV